MVKFKVEPDAFFRRAREVKSHFPSSFFSAEFTLSQKLSDEIEIQVTETRWGKEEFFAVKAISLGLGPLEKEDKEATMKVKDIQDLIEIFPEQTEELIIEFL